VCPSSDTAVNSGMNRPAPSGPPSLRDIPIAVSPMTSPIRVHAKISHAGHLAEFRR
jgi:hypothetical protein